MQMDDNEEVDDTDGQFDDDDATPRPHKHANAHKSQIDEGPFRTPLVLDSKYRAVDRAIDTVSESDHSDSEDLGNAHKEHERQGVSYTGCLLLWRLTIQ